MSYNTLCLRCFRDLGGYEVCMHCGHVHTGKPTVSIHLMPGSILHGEYLIGYATHYTNREVWYSALHQSTGKRMIVREFLPLPYVSRSIGTPQVYLKPDADSGAYARGYTRFEQEMQMLYEHGDLSALIKVRHYFEENGTIYGVSAFVEGAPLSQMLKQNKDILDISTATRLIKQLCDALDNLHRRNILHLNLSPDALYIVQNERILLLGLENASLPNAYEKPFMAVLPMGIAALEQYHENLKPTEATEVYQLAALFYRMITGISIPEAIDRVHRDEIVAPSQFGVQLSPALERVLFEALQIEQEQRMKSTKEFLEALENPKDHKSLKCGSTRKAKRKKRVRVVPLVAAGLIFLVGVAMIAISQLLYAVRLQSEDPMMSNASIVMQEQLNDPFGEIEVVSDGDAEIIRLSTINDDERLKTLPNEMQMPEGAAWLSTYFQNGDAKAVPTGFAVYLMYIRNDKPVDMQAILSEWELISTKKFVVESESGVQSESDEADTKDKDESAGGEAELPGLRYGILSNVNSAMSYLYNMSAQEVHMEQEITAGTDKELYTLWSQGEIDCLIGRSDTYSDMLALSEGMMAAQLLFVPEGKLNPVCFVDYYGVTAAHPDGKQLKVLMSLLDEDTQRILYENKNGVFPVNQLSFSGIFAQQNIIFSDTQNAEAFITSVRVMEQ